MAVGLRSAGEGNAGTAMPLVQKIVIRISLSSEMIWEIWESLSWELLGDGKSSDWENEYL